MRLVIVPSAVAAHRVGLTVGRCVSRVDILQFTAVRLAHNDTQCMFGGHRRLGLHSVDVVVATAAAVR